MTVAELVAKLQDMPQEVNVFFDFGDDGLEAVESVDQDPDGDVVLS